MESLNLYRIRYEDGVEKEVLKVFENRTRQQLVDWVQNTLDNGEEDMANSSYVIATGKPYSRELAWFTAPDEEQGGYQWIGVPEDELNW